MNIGIVVGVVLLIVWVALMVAAVAAIRLAGEISQAEDNR